jgi:membrane protease YdiL (CAAX protease family)
MKLKTWLLPSVTAILAIVILKLPYNWLFPSFTEYQQDLLVNATKGILIILFALLLLWHYRLWKNACFPLNRVKSFVPFLPAFLLVLIFVVLSGKSFRDFKGDLPLIISVIGITILRTSAEELICRGVMQSWFMGKGITPRRSIILASIIFAFMHISNILVHGDWVSMVNQVIFAFLMGLMLGSVTLMTGNILFSCLLHTLTNLPAAFKKYNPVEEIPGVDDTAFVSFGESLLQILMFLIIFSPLILVALYYFNHQRWMPRIPPAARDQS